MPKSHENQEIILNETTRKINELETVFDMVQQFSINFNQHVTVIDKLVQSLLEISAEPHDSALTIRNNSSAQHRLTFQAPSGFSMLRQGSFAKQRSNSRSVKEGTMGDNMFTMHEESNQNINSEPNSRKVSKESKQNGNENMRNLFKTNHSNNLSNFNETEIQSLKEEPMEVSQQNKRAIQKSEKDMIDSQIKKQRPFEMIYEDKDAFNQFLKLGRENCHDLKTLFDQLFKVKSEKSADDDLKEKHAKLKIKYDKLKSEYKSLEKENTELKISTATNKINTDETQKLNERMKSSFLTNNLEKSIEGATIDTYKRKIESQAFKINILKEERNNISSLLDAANAKLNFLEQDITNMRNEFIELYKVIYENLEMPSSIKTINVNETHDIDYGSLHYLKDNFTNNESEYQRIIQRMETWDNGYNLPNIESPKNTENLKASMRIKSYCYKDHPYNLSADGNLKLSLADSGKRIGKRQSRDLANCVLDDYNSKPQSNDNLRPFEDLNQKEEELSIEEIKSDKQMSKFVDEVNLIESDTDEKGQQEILVSHRTTKSKNSSFLKRKNTLDISNTDTKKHNNENGQDQQTKKTIVDKTPHKNSSNVFENNELEDEYESGHKKLEKANAISKLSENNQNEIFKIENDKKSHKSENSYSLVQMSLSNNNSFNSKTIESAKGEDNDRNTIKYKPSQFINANNNGQEASHNRNARHSKTSRRSSSLDNLGFPNNGETTNFYTFSNNPNSVKKNDN